MGLSAFVIIACYRCYRLSLTWELLMRGAKEVIPGLVLSPKSGYVESRNVGYPTIKLSSGNEMPILGLGTWLSTNEHELTSALKAALDCGYRLIDTAFYYGNEPVIGKVLHEYFAKGKLKREDIFITSKLPPTAHAPADVEKVLKIQLDALQLDYLDLYLVHAPVPFKKQDDTFVPAFVDGFQVPITIDHVETWHALEKLYDAGKVKALGLSNFNTKQVQNVYDHARIKPSNLQIECHIYWPQTELFQLCKKLNMSLTAYSPLGSRGRKAFNEKMIFREGDPLTDPLVKELAEKHKKTAAQVLLRHLIQRGIAVIPKSVKPQRVKENFGVFDFTLSPQEMEKLDNIKKRTRLFLFDFAINHPFYPFEDVDRSKVPLVSLQG